MAYGTVNADVIGTSVAGSNLGAGNASIMKNRIINGAMVIDQRNAGASVTPASGTSTYTIDRWRFYTSVASKFTTQQNAGSVTPPVGFTNYLGITSSSAYSVAAGDVIVLNQYIEGYNFADLGWGTANAKTITISFWARSSLTGTFGGYVTTNTGSRYYCYGYTINAANTWEYKTVTIAGDTSASWSTSTTNGVGAEIGWCVSAGTNYNGTANTWSSSSTLAPTGSVNLVGTNGATLYITGVQLEVGSSATGFEYRQYTTELALCQRYYVQYGGSTSFIIGSGDFSTANRAYIFIKYPTTMRASPTVGGTSAGFTLNVLGSPTDSTSVSLTSTIFNSPNLGGFQVDGSGGSASIGVGCAFTANSSSSVVTVSSEL